VSLADLIQAEIKKPGTKCGIEAVYEQLDETDAATLHEVMASKVAHVVIYRALAKQGIEIGRSVVERHRKRECACVTL